MFIPTEPLPAARDSVSYLPCSTGLEALHEVVALADDAPTLLWVSCGSCSGESMSILGAEGRGKDGDTLMEFLEREGVRLLWHPSVSPESPGEVVSLIARILAGKQPLTLLCVEGSIIHGPHGTGQFDTFDGVPKRDIVDSLCKHAEYVLAMGSCAAFGGIPAAPPNPSESTGLQFTNNRPGGLLSQEWRSRAGMPVINLSACPVDATTMVRTMGILVEGRALELDRYQRPALLKPCLSGADERSCRTAEKVGYACYGCIGAKFPLARALFKHPKPRSTAPLVVCDVTAPLTGPSAHADEQLVALAAP
jgi:Ni,Fe-hydrogenase I small subunit